MATPLIVRGHAKERSLEDMCADHQCYVSSGSVKKDAQMFFNCISEPIFDIPVSQVNESNITIIRVTPYRSAHQVSTSCWGSSLDNATPWANLNHVGCGLLGEQGAESIHAKFTRLGLAYTAVTDKVQHLLCIVKEHLKSIAPQVVAGCSMCFERVDLQCLTGGTTELKSATKAMFGLGTKPR